MLHYTHIFIIAFLSSVHISYSHKQYDQDVDKTENKNNRQFIDTFDTLLSNRSRRLSGEYSEYPEYDTDVKQDRKYQLESQTPGSQEAVKNVIGNAIHNRSSGRRSKERFSTSTEIDSVHMIDNWPDANKQLGQLSAVSLDTNGNVVVFHRGDRVWNAQTFLPNNVYGERHLGPIIQNTIVTFHSSSGMVLHEWGSNLFYMPHGLTVDFENNIWITDVALHQVFKFGPNGGPNSKPLLTLGVQFTPGKDLDHFCKPTDVAIMLNGDFFVSDGYCNTRVLKYSSTGEFLISWGRSSFQSNMARKFPMPYEFNVPHALALAVDKNLICVADRENGRVQCFDCHNGTFVMQLFSPLLGTRIFSVAYSPIKGGLLYVVNGPDATKETAAGFIVSMASNTILEFQPTEKSLSNPHDVAVSPDGNHVYVVELNPYRVWRFDRGNENANNTSDAPLKSTTVTTRNEHHMPLGSKNISGSPIDTSRIVEPLHGLQQEPSTIATAVGIILVIIVVIGLVLTAAIIRMKKRGKKEGYSNEHNVQYSKLIG